MAQDRRDEIERLFRRYGEGVGSYLLARVGDPELAEELTARVFLTVVRHIDQLRGSAAGWLWAIVRTELARHYRDRGHRDIPADLPARDGLPPDQAARRETQVLLQTALASLTDEQQQLVSMKFFLQMRNLDIAEALGMTPSNVGVLLHRTLKQLRKLVGQEDEVQAKELSRERPSQ